MKRKANHLKVLTGTDQPCRMSHEATPTAEPLDQAPAPPSWMVNVHAVAEWNRLAPLLVVNKLLTEQALSTLGHLCNIHGELVRLSSAGMAPTGHMLAQYRALANDFGLTPVAQGKVRSGAEPKKANPFDGL